MTSPRACLILSLLCSLAGPTQQQLQKREYKICSAISDCLPLWKCKSVFNELWSANKGQMVKIMKRHLCQINPNANSGDKLLVCCPKSSGKKAESFSVHDTPCSGPCKAGDYCWLAHLVYTDVDDRLAEIIRCGGSLISQRIVLTAGHCLNCDPKDSWELTHVRLGKLDRNGHCLRYDCQFTVGKTFLHPSKDIGLVKLKTPVDKAHFVPLCLLSEEMSRHNPVNVFFVSIAALSDAWYVLMSATHDTSKHCPKLDEHGDICLPKGTKLPFEPMEGDSGAPLVVLENSKHYQVGVMVTAHHSKQYFIFVKLQPLLGWIKVNMGN